jgi:hypothetical protein
MQVIGCSIMRGPQAKSKDHNIGSQQRNCWSDLSRVLRMPDSVMLAALAASPASLPADSLLDPLRHMKFIKTLRRSPRLLCVWTQLMPSTASDAGITPRSCLAI